MAPVDADRNLLFGVLALQGELIDAGQLAEACTAWSVRKDRSLADHLVERGWISAEDRHLIEQLLERRLKKHSGDAHRSLVAAASGAAGVLATLQGVQARVVDEDIRQSLADVPHQQTATGTFEYVSRISPPLGSRDRYTLTTLHAKGGIGQVWLARDTEMDREIALKELRPDRSDDMALRRFFQEAQITGQLDHPGVVPVYELARGEPGRDGCRPYYTMRFVRGGTFSDAIAVYHRNRAGGQARRTDLLALIQAFVGVCNTVAFAHSRGVIHRDLKGSNIILGEFGEVVLLDWGLAKFVDRDGAVAEPGTDFDPAMTGPYPGTADRAGSDLTAAGQVLGTPSYMAPEQAEGRVDRIGRRTDVYGLGTILYEILAGQPPFEGPSTLEVLRKVREELPAPPGRLCRSAPKALEAICLKAIAKDPEARYGSASELAADVQHWLADEPVSAWREPWAIRARRWVVRHRTQVSAGVAALVVAVVGLAATLAMQARANRELRSALDRERLARDDASTQSKQAEEAIQSLYKGITEDVILRRPELEQLRSQLLRAALRFYEERVNYLSDAPTHDVRAIRNIATGLNRIASLQAMLGDRDSAIRTRRRLVELYDANPVLGKEAATQARLDLGNLQRLAGRPDDAERSLRQALDGYEQIENPWKAGLTMSDLGRLLVDMGKANEGRQILDRAREKQEGLLAASPSLGWRRGDLAATYTTLGNLHEGEARLAESLSFYQKAEAIYQEINAQAVKSDFYQAELARALNNLGLAKVRTGKLVEGQHDVERGQAIRERLLADQPLNIERRADLARSSYHLARIQVLMGAVADAIGSIRKAEELYAGIPPKGPEDIYFRACMKALLAGLLGAGKAEGEVSPADRAERQRVADEAVGLLKQAVGAGYANPSRLKNDPPLESLHSRPDFQELLRSLRRPSE
jgi:serine/threonine-protein kinase